MNRVPSFQDYLDGNRERHWLTKLQNLQRPSDSKRGKPCITKWNPIYVYPEASPNEYGAYSIVNMVGVMYHHFWIPLHLSSSCSKDATDPTVCLPIMAPYLLLQNWSLFLSFTWLRLTSNSQVVAEPPIQEGEPCRQQHSLVDAGKCNHFTAHS